ncbi:peptidase U34 [Aeromicrobium sp. PE09-221]|uniref:C69 family dipeptidase n=1 Tax=Aeromicrobium sp. PE09-221 TaxID=1898043 RepID=UPI000B6EE682|nr:C69 family dipeptidase [Aeromicrobium sp. PE09-221]OUZ11715.1 peptidase U34 [Aeromicrobium sp. PE09-221]
MFPSPAPSHHARRRRLACALATGVVATVAVTALPAAADVPGERPELGPDKSIAFYVGKDLTEDGHPLIGGFGHEPSSHWVEVVPAQDHPEGSTVTVGVTEDADMPGELTEIPQVEHTFGYITSNYSEFTGLPAPLMNGGLNEKNVAARDVWSNSREELWDMTPEDQTGPQYSDLSRFAMERASTAREAVEILGELIDEHGYSTYGGNSHMFADEDEGWIFIEYSGGEGLWAAERLGPDEVRVSYPGYIQEFPTEAVEGDDPDYLGSSNLVSFAEEQGWYDAQTDDLFDLQEVYQQPFPTDPFEVGEVADPEDPAPYRNPISLEAELQELAPVSLQDMMRLVRDPRWSDDRSGYGQVAELRSDLADPRLATLWLAPTSAVTAPYTPIAIGTESLPEELTQHRYLTAEASGTYLDPAFAEQEATEYATQTYKRLMYATCARPDEYLGEVTAAFEGFEAGALDEWSDVQEEAAGLVEDGDDPSAVLTDYTTDNALDGLALGNHLLDDILARSREDGGLRAPDIDVPEGTTGSARSQSMVLGAHGDIASSRDRMNCDLGGGWADGSTLDRQGEYGDPGDVPDFSAASISGRPELSDDGGNATALVLGLGGLIVGLALGALAQGRRKRA